ncbi:Uncharacterised protein [Mycobacteroides abscessus subsp. abscessus]|nr:Uncharacterised protein [Mycobacteroides abscessus subsp. abscessus]
MQQLDHKPSKFLPYRGNQLLQHLLPTHLVPCNQLVQNHLLRLFQQYNLYQMLVLVLFSSWHFPTQVLSYLAKYTIDTQLESFGILDLL